MALNVPEDSTSRSSESTPIILSGRVGIVYIGEDFTSGVPFCVGKTYSLEKALSTENSPTIGIQLRKRFDRGFAQCGWVRKREYAQIMSHLNAGNTISGTVLSRDKFSWNSAKCYWGTLEWSVDEK